jgi:hypothetical protein
MVPTWLATLGAFGCLLGGYLLGFIRGFHRGFPKGAYWHRDRSISQLPADAASVSNPQEP